MEEVDVLTRGPLYHHNNWNGEYDSVTMVTYVTCVLQKILTTKIMKANQSQTNQCYILRFVKYNNY